MQWADLLGQRLADERLRRCERQLTAQELEGGLLGDRRSGKPVEQLRSALVQARPQHRQQRRGEDVQRHREAAEGAPRVQHRLRHACAGYRQVFEGLASTRRDSLGNCMWCLAPVYKQRMRQGPGCNDLCAPFQAT